MSRNIVLVTVDSLRADHCGFLTGNHSGLTPTLDSLADEGIIFEHAIAPGPRTPSSMPESFTGEPLRQDGDGHVDDYWQHRRAFIRRHMQRHRSIAEQLEERGYTTVGVTANPWTQDTAFDAGFDRFVEINSTALESYGPPVFKYVDGVLHGNPVGDRLYWHNKREWFIRWTDFYDRIATELEAVSSPFFLWVFLLDVHQPYIAPKQFRRESSALEMYYASFSELSRDGQIPTYVETRLRKAYRDTVRSADAFLKRLWNDCDGADPILLVHADHGEAFGEHGTYGHEQQLYQENIHVPFVVANVEQAERIPEPFSLRLLPDVISTLADQESLNSGQFTSDFVVSATENAQTTAVSCQTWKYILNENGEELYHLESDTTERTNVATRYPVVATALRRLAKRRQSDQRERDTVSDVVRAAAIDRRRLPEQRSNGGRII